MLRHCKGKSRCSRHSADSASRCRCDDVNRMRFSTVAAANSATTLSGERRRKRYSRLKSRMGSPLGGGRSHCSTRPGSGRHSTASCPVGGSGVSSMRFCSERSSGYGRSGEVGSTYWYSAVRYASICAKNGQCDVSSTHLAA